MTDRDWFIEQYDEHLAADGNAVSREKSRDVVAHAYADAVETGAQPRQEFSLIEEGRKLFDEAVAPTLKSRRSSMRTDIGYLLDAIDNPIEAATVGPILAKGFPLGNGSDRTLAYWTVEDWIGARTERYRNAAKATEAAARFDEQSQAVIDHMTEAGVTMTGRLF